MSEEQSPQELIPKRVRRERQITNQQEQDQSDQFWKNNPYFQDAENEDDSDDYQPVDVDESNESQQASNDDYVDSLADPWESVSQSQCEQKSQGSQLNLLRQNLRSYSTMRGLHSMIDIATLQRLGQSSYVVFDDSQTYATNPILNRLCKSVPYTGNDTGHDEQIKTKTEYHTALFRLEDKRYFIDIEILQLKRIQKLVEKNKFQHFLGFRKMQIDQETDLELTIQKQINRLQLQKSQLQVDKELEEQIYMLTIDQLYYDKIKHTYQKTTSRYIQEESNLLAKNLNQQSEDKWYNQNFKALQNIHPNLILPLFVYDFSDIEAIKITAQMLESALKLVGSSYNNRWMITLFYDMITGLFDIEIPSERKEFKLTNSEFLEMLSKLSINKLPENQSTKKPTIQMDDPLNQQTKIKFYPDFKPFKYNLFCRPVVEYSISLIHMIYQRVSKILTLNQIIQYKGEEYELKYLLIDICYKQLNEIIPEPYYQIIFKNIFNEDDALFFSPLVCLITQWRRLFYQFDQWSLELMIAWSGAVLGNDSKQIIQEVKERLAVDASLLIQKMKQETQNTRMCRIQTVENILLIHQFELNNLYEQ